MIWMSHLYFDFSRLFSLPSSLHLSLSLSFSLSPPPLPHAPHQWYFEPRSIQTTTRRQGHLKSQSLKSAQRKHFQTFWCATPSFIPQFLPCLGEGETERLSLPCPLHCNSTAWVILHPSSAPINWSIIISTRKGRGEERKATDQNDRNYRNVNLLASEMDRKRGWYCGLESDYEWGLKVCALPSSRMKNSNVSK